MSQLLVIFVLSTENNEIVQQMCYLLFSLNLKSILSNDLPKQYNNPIDFINFKYML